MMLFIVAQSRRRPCLRDARRRRPMR